MRLPLGTQAANQQHGMNLRQAVLEAPLAVLAGLSLSLFNHVGAADSARLGACEGQPLSEYPGDKFHV